MSNESAKTSNADKLIEAVQEVRKKETPAGRIECPKCGSGRYSSRRPLGGPLICVCSDCGHQYHQGRPNMAPLLAAHKPNPQGTGRGPVRSKPRPKKDKHTPHYRNKGKTK